MPSREHEPIRRSCVRRQLVALFQTDRHTIRVHQQMVLGQKPSKQHPMPILVGQLLTELVNALRLVGSPLITRLPSASTQPIPQHLLGRFEVSVRLSNINRPPYERRPRGLLSLFASVLAHVVELRAEFGIECGLC